MEVLKINDDDDDIIIITSGIIIIIIIIIINTSGKSKLLQLHLDHILVGADAVIMLRTEFNCQLL